MNRKITEVALAVLMLLVVTLPASAQIQATSVEVRGTIASESAPAGGIDLSNPAVVNAGISWSPQTFAGFFYDLKDNLGTENLAITNASDSAGTFNQGGNRRIPKGAMSYSTTGQPKLLKVVDQKFPGNISGAANAGLLQTGSGKAFEGGDYTTLGWQAEQYVALNGKVDKLAKLVIEQGTAASDKQSLTVGQSWDVGGGWTLVANSIDAKATPRQVWITLSKDGVQKDNAVLSQGGIYTYVEKSIGGETDVPLFVTFVDSVFSGATSDMVQLRYTWAISTDVTQISSGNTYGVFKNANVIGKSLSLKNDDTSVTLTRDSVQNLMGNLNFRVADNDTLRFYPVVEYAIGGNVTPSPTVGTPTGSATVTATGNVTGTAITTPSETVTETGVAGASVTAAVSATPTPRVPGFEMASAIVGLLAVAFLVLRQKRK